MLKLEDILPVKSVEASGIPKYHREILQRGHCTGFLPVTFLEGEGGVQMMVNTEEYLPIREHRQKKEKSRWLCFSHEMLTTLEQLLLLVKDNQQHLFFSHQYDISESTVFLHSKRQEVKLFYRYRNTGDGPAGEKTRLVDQIIALLLTLEADETDREWIFYSQHIRREAERDNLGINSLLKLVRKLKEEASGIQWGSENS